MTDLVADLAGFIDAAPSPFHTVAAAAGRLEAAGWNRLEETASWRGQPTDRGFLVRDGSLVAWSRPVGVDAAAPWRLLGAHTDSPNLRIRPRPDGARAGAQQLAVEVYGGPLLNSWLDRDLGLSGRVALADGTVVLLTVDRPVLKIPQLAIHLDRDVTTTGLLLNPQLHLAPIWGLGEADPDGFRRFVAGELGVGADDIVAWDVMTHDVQPASVVGRDGELLAAPRLDNLCSTWAAVDALTGLDPAAGNALVVLFDHEEIGSTSNRGADSTLVEAVLERLVGDRDDLRRALAGSFAASADMAHATHPNYAERHEPNHWIRLGGGPAVKTNVNQRYATDARSAAVLVAAAAQAGVTLQWYSHRGDLPCGSTIGPVTAARLGVATVDVGAPMLGMHSARETMAVADVAPYRQLMAAFLAPGTPPPI